jgi:hypothetical protein
MSASHERYSAGRSWLVSGIAIFNYVEAARCSPDNLYLRPFAWAMKCSFGQPTSDGATLIYWPGTYARGSGFPKNRTLGWLPSRSHRSGCPDSAIACQLSRSAG